MPILIQSIVAAIAFGLFYAGACYGLEKIAEQANKLKGNDYE